MAGHSKASDVPNPPLPTDGDDDFGGAADVASRVRRAIHGVEMHEIGLALAFVVADYMAQLPEGSRDRVYEAHCALVSDFLEKIEATEGPQNDWS